MLTSITVKDYMVGDVITFTPDTDVLEAIRKLVEHGISGAPVVDHLGNMVGFLSEKDCMKVALQASYYGERGGNVSQFMVHKVETVEAETNLVEVAEMFMKGPHRRFPVVDDENRLVGTISRRDILKALEVLW